MTLGCRFGMVFNIYYRPYDAHKHTLSRSLVTTDQWLTTRVDTSWTVSQVKLHMLTKFFGARRDQLKAFNHPGESYTESTWSSHYGGPRSQGHIHFKPVPGRLRIPRIH